jgi:arylsulfatase
MFRPFVYIVIIVLFLHGCGKAKPAVEKLNIILLAVDTLRADHMHCYGYPYPTTPRIDGFAKKTSFFEHAFCPIPKTSSSFASMMTGLHPSMHKTSPNRGPLDTKFQTLAEILQSNGYHTAAVVDNANLSRFFQFDQGFASYTEVWNEVDEKKLSTPFITEKVISFMNEPQKKPFFLWVNYIETHTPYVPPPSFVQARPLGRDVREVKDLVLPRRVKLDMEANNNYFEGYYVAQYDGAVSYMDAEVGKIIDTFFRKGLDKNTIFIIVSDHGEDLGERNYFFDHGSLTFTASVRVPLIVYLPGSKPAAIKTPVSIMDIYPTILESMQIQAPYPLQGVSLLTPEKDRMLYILGIGSDAVVKNNNHYVNVSPRLSKKLNQQPNHFYDFYRDPMETQNLYSGQAGSALALAKKFDAFIEQYGSYLKAPAGNGRRKLSDKERKSLKTLGYL